MTYEESGTNVSKMLVLSFAASNYPKKAVQEMFNCTRYKVDQARAWAKGNSG